MLKYSGELDLVFQALGDPTRRALVDQLAHGPASVSELAAPLPISMPAVLQHLHALEDSGLIRSEKVGRVRTCHLEPKMLNSAQTWIEARKAMWERRLDRLDAFLAALPPEEPPTTKPGRKT
ncbi:MAG: hypothetical protein QOG80_1092 [Pseudonocardiales bacterium]|jgi:DNA-binding transcriptional ArsR family regulator|nr:hypothetical protein [Pseudonocardiales bacterium]